MPQETSAPDNSEEKRAAERAPLWTRVSWTEDGQQWHEDESQDISRSGMLLRTQQHLAPGASLKLQLKLPGKKFIDPIIADAKVARVVYRHDHQVGVGLRFIRLRSHDHTVVHEFVCKIMGLPLENGLLDTLAEKEDGYSSYRMDRLLGEADKETIRRAEQRLARETAKVQKERFRLWFHRGKKVILLMLLSLLAFKAYGCAKVVLDLLSHGR